MVPPPAGNCNPFTAKVAVDLPTDPVNGADPNKVLAMENETDPDVVVPSVEVTVAVKYTTSFADTVARLLSSVMLELDEGGGVTLPPSQPITSLYASTEPRPVA